MECTRGSQLMRFVTLPIDGADGMVRGFFMARSLAAPPASQQHFPGVRAVAVLPKRFESAAAAETWLKETAEQGGNAVAVQIAPTRWLIGAWVAEIPSAI
jgi:hypothetical protein